MATPFLSKGTQTHVIVSRTGLVSKYTRHRAARFLCLRRRSARNERQGVFQGQAPVGLGAVGVAVVGPCARSEEESSPRVGRLVRRAAADI